MSDKNKVRFSLKNICRNFNNHSIGPVNFDIFENEILGLTGKTGCGKTTIAEIIMRLMEFDSGTLIYKEIPIQSVPIREFRQKNQMMFQNHLLSVNSLLKIGKIITEPLKIANIHDREITERVDVLLEMFELPANVLKKYPEEVSGGELQRLIFLRAMILKPEFIILDEPFSNIDRNMSLRLIMNIKKIKKEASIQKIDLGILIITHSPEFAELFSDRILEFSKLLRSESL